MYFFKGSEMKQMQKQQQGFTLLELLVVIGILAIIGGTVVASLDGQEAKASKGAATHSLAAIEQAVRLYNVNEGALPDELDSLACISVGADPSLLDGAVDHPADATPANASKYGGSSNLPGVGGGVSQKLAGKFSLVKLHESFGEALDNAGIIKIRYAELTTCNNDDNADGAPAGFPTGNLVDVDIPNRGFDAPTSGKNRGRGFAREIHDPSDSHEAIVMVWNRGTNGVNNTKIGADADAVLIGLGLGNNASIVGGENLLSQAPYYGGIAKDKYSRYVLLINVGTDDDTTDGTRASTGTTGTVTAKGTPILQAIIDANGDFLDEEFAEFTGQKS